MEYPELESEDISEIDLKKFITVTNTVDDLQVTSGEYSLPNVILKLFILAISLVFVSFGLILIKDGLTTGESVVGSLIAATVVLLLGVGAILAIYDDLKLDYKFRKRQKA